MQTYRRLASTATSTSRSASTASMHQHTHTRLSRSSSTTSTTTTNSMTPVEVGSFPHSRMAIPISRGLPSPTAQRNTSTVFASPPTHDQYTRAELETIAESLLAHVTFGPYHLASSPVPSSHLRLAMTSSHRPDTKENVGSPLSASTTSVHDGTPTLGFSNTTLPSSSQRHFEGKEGTHSNNHHPRARFTIGGGESERGRGMGRKSVGLSVRDVNHTNEYGYERERGRDMRGRSGNVKGLQYS